MKCPNCGFDLPGRLRKPKTNDGGLLTALRLAVSVADQRAHLPAPGGILLRSRDGHLVLAAMDIQDWFETDLPGVPFGGPDVIVNGRVLCHEAARLGPLALHATGSDDSVMLHVTGSGRNSSDLPTMKAGDFPPRPPVPGPASEGVFDAGTLHRALARVWSAISDDSNRYGIGGLRAEVGLVAGRWPVPEGVCRFVATDGNQLRYADVPVEGACRPPDGKLWSRESVERAVAMLATEETRARLTFTERHVTLAIGRCTLVSRLLDGEFPDYRKCLGEPGPHEVTVEAAALVAALKSVLPFALDRCHAVVLETGYDALTVSASSIDTGSKSVAVPTTVVGGDAKVGVNAKMMLDTLSVLDGPSVTLRFGGPVDPIYAEEPGFMGVVMPVRLY